jgi:hypothetical protein
MNIKGMIRDDGGCAAPILTCTGCLGMSVLSLIMGSLACLGGCCVTLCFPIIGLFGGCSFCAVAEASAFCGIPVACVLAILALCGPICGAVVSAVTGISEKLSGMLGGLTGGK